MSVILRSLAAAALVVSIVVSAPPLFDRPFDMRVSGEAVAAIAVQCERCDWGSTGREAAVLKLMVDGVYSQHLLVTRGQTRTDYRVMLGRLSAGTHRLVVELDEALSARQAGRVNVRSVNIDAYPAEAPEHEWLSRAPLLYARRGTVERFSDVPLLMYVEADAGGYRYTVIFSHEDGGTPTDRLMATWGRTTDIEYVYGFVPATDGGKPREEYQGADHALLPFRGTRSGSHPLLWIATDNNMFSDAGPEAAVRFAPAPSLVTLDNVSREVVMDANPWLYSVTSAELGREGRIVPDVRPGSGHIVDPRRFAVVEACGDLQDATLAFDIGIDAQGGHTSWHPSDLGQYRFRIARSGCFRAAAPMPVGTTPAQIHGLRARAYTRPPRENETPLPAGTGRVTLTRVNTIFMLDRSYKPVRSDLRWSGSLVVMGEAGAVEIAVASAR